jgi:hypothetical protein
MAGYYCVYCLVGGCYTVPTVTDTIPNIAGGRKGGEYGIALVLVLLGAVSFGLGRLSATNDAPSTIATCAAAPAALPIAQAGGEQAVPRSAVGGQFVASKNGSVYHLPWCSGAQRIKEENKVWFASKDAAARAGYRPAANCKGL